MTLPKNLPNLEKKQQKSENFNINTKEILNQLEIF